VEIITEPESAEVWLGNEFAEYAPCTLKVPIGIGRRYKPKSNKGEERKRPRPRKGD
jgi:hypothetical protein